MAFDKWCLRRPKLICVPIAQHFNCRLFHNSLFINEQNALLGQKISRILFRNRIRLFPIRLSAAKAFSDKFFQRLFDEGILITNSYSKCEFELAGI